MVSSSSATKRDTSAKDGPFFEETSAITAPGNTPRTGTRAHSDASIGKRQKASAITLMAKQSAASGNLKGKGKKKTKDKPELVTPAEFARRLRHQGQGAPVTGPSETETETGNHKERQHVKVAAQAPSQYLKDYVIFYAGGDLTYASARTRGCMSYVRLLFVLLFDVLNNWRAGRSTNMVGPCFPLLTLRWQRTSSPKRARR